MIAFGSEAVQNQMQNKRANIKEIEKAGEEKTWYI